MHIRQYLKTVFSNLTGSFHWIGQHNVGEQIQFLNVQEKNSLKHIDIIEKNIDQIRKNLIELHYEIHKDEGKKYSDELNYLQSQDFLPMIPYKQKKHLEFVPNAEYDNNKKLPFIVHKGKRLYFPATWSLESVKNQYQYYIERENLVGGGYTDKAPHQYQSDSLKISTGDILLDIGSAEGLLALDTIETTKRIFLFESDAMWIAPLEATFEPYKEKVSIINKYVSDSNSATTTTLSNAIQGFKDETFFVKMDIEGAEEFVIKENSDFFKQNQIKLACCTYHKKDHYQSINAILEKWGYMTHPSDGYILCFMYNDFMPPFFRRGVIRATNIT